MCGGVGWSSGGARVWAVVCAYAGVSRVMVVHGTADGGS